MIIFIRNIPAFTRLSELKDFTEPALKRWFFFRYGNIVKVEIISIRDKITGLYEFHGLVHIDSEIAGRIALQRLQEKLFKNKPVVVREYVFRNWHNDRRSNQTIVTMELLSQRVADRRRGTAVEIMQEVSIIFNATPGSLRKYPKRKK